MKANGQIEQDYGLDADGNIISVKDREGRTTLIENDSLGRPVSWTYEDGHREKVKRDAQGAIVWQESVSPGAGKSHSFDQEVDSFGRVLKRQSAGGGSGVDVVSTYDAAGRLLTQEDKVAGVTESFAYGDALGRLTRHTRTVKSKSGDLNWIETRQYLGNNEVRVSRQIDTGSGTREENQTLVMDALGRVLSEAQVGKGSSQYTYDARGNVLTRQHSVLGTTTYTYNGLGHLLSVTAPGGVTTTYTVDAGGRVLTQQGPHEDERWTFTYDLFGRPLTRVLAAGGGAAGASWSFTYPGNGTVLETDPLGAQTTRHFNSRNLLLREERGSRTTEYAYDGTWPRLQHVIHEGSDLKLTRTFDDLGRPLLEVETWQQGGRSYSYSTSTTWAGRSGTRLEQWEATGASPQTRTALIEVDGLGNLVERQQGGLTDAWTYDAAGVLAREALAGRPVKQFRYVQDLLSQVEYGSETTQYSYDAAGRLSSETDPSGRTRTRTYNAQGLVASESYGVGETLESSFTYDRGGFLRTMTRGGAQWTFTHGPRGELRSVDLPDGLGSFAYQYDALLRLTQVTPPAGGGAAVQTFGYDSFDRQRRRTRGTSVWSTDWQGGLSVTSDPNGNVVERLHDARGRIASELFRPGPSSQPFNDLTGVAYAYDGLDQLLSAQESRNSGAVSNVYEYDGRSRLKSLRRGNEVVTYTHTASGQRQTVTSPSGTVHYEYDGQDRVQLIQSSQGPSVTVGWEPGGLLSEVSGNGVVERYAYWGHGLIRSITSSWGAAPAGSQLYEYKYDTRGNRVEERYTGPGATGPEVTQYGYDAADRLTGVRYPSGESDLYVLGGDGSRLEEQRLQAYQGGLGPRAQAVASSLTKHWRYSYDTAGGLERIDDVLTGGVEAQLTTDPGGRVVSEVRGGTTRNYGWDAAGRLAWVRRMTSEDNVEASYTYGFDGLRRSRTVAGVGTRYVWGANEELLEEGPAAGSGLLYARADFGAVAAGGERLLHDALGSVVGRVGATAKLSRYGAWGELRQGDAPDSQGPTLAYAGQHFDSDVGLSYAQQRWYSTELGRFLSEDPVGAMGYLSTPTELNPWLYARSNPMTYLDPAGRWSWSQFKEGVTEFGIGTAKGAYNAFSWVSRPLNAALGVSTGHYDEKGVYQLESTGSVSEEFEKQRQQVKAVVTYVANNPLETAEGLVADVGKAIGTGAAACFIAATTEGAIGDQASKDCGATLPEAISAVAGTFTGAGAAAKAGVKVAGKVAGKVDDLRDAVKTAVSTSEDLAKQRMLRERAEADRTPDTSRADENGCTGGSCGIEGQECFVAGTPVMTIKGLKPIEQIGEGDLVWSRDDETGEADWRPVVRTFVTPNKAVMKLELTDATGQRTVLGVTGEHPFWVKDMGWMGAASLLPGQQVASASGGWLKVGTATWEQDRATVFNFEVEDFHTYFVGDAGAWVHNSCGPDGKDGASLLRRFRERVGLAPFEPTDGTTVAVALSGTGQRAFGLNSTLSGGKAIRARAFELLQRANQAGKARTYNQQQFLLHAEAQALTRLAKKGGDLSLVRLHVDRATCNQCIGGLPKLREALGVKRLEVYNNGSPKPAFVFE
ncbi:MAG TPA: polymorphic toxin-type HINT domain-containing protein [Myxococcaceae bacterium]